MQDLYLKFDSQEAAQSVLYTVPVSVEDAEGVMSDDEPRPLYLNIDQVGVIYEPTGELIEQDGFDVQVMQALPGWHVNVRLMPGEDGTPLESYRVHPASPQRVWG
jgi:hypothetical protein